MHFHVITVHPGLLSSYTSGSMLGRAQEDDHISIETYNPWEHAPGGFKNVDGKPYGGGPGMVQRALPFMKAIEEAVGRKKNVVIILFTPGVEKFTSTHAETLSQKKHVILVAGHYEGIDARLKEMIVDRYGSESVFEYSVGDYVLTGGELPSLVVIDAVSRFVPGVLGNVSSIEDRRISSPDVYTRPEVITYKGKNYAVPDVLLSGNHKEIDEWRKTNRSDRTLNEEE